MNEIRTIKIPGTLPGLNEYTRANRAHKQIGAKLKKETEQYISFFLPKVELKTPVRLIFNWVEPNRRRDKDNICFAKKFCLDALVSSGCLPNDGWAQIDRFEDYFSVDKENPRVEVIVMEGVR